MIDNFISHFGIPFMFWFHSSCKKKKQAISLETDIIFQFATSYPLPIALFSSPPSDVVRGSNSSLFRRALRNPMWTTQSKTGDDTVTVLETES